MNTVYLSPAARAASQLQSIGKNIRMGQRIQFIYTKTKQGVRAWDLPEPFNPALIDIAKYKELLFRAVHEVLQPLGVTEECFEKLDVQRSQLSASPVCSIIGLNCLYLRIWGGFVSIYPRVLGREPFVIKITPHI